MKILMNRTFAKLACLTSVLALVACNGADTTEPNSGQNQGNSVGQSQACGDDDEDEANDKVVCVVDSDCDADEVCTQGRCTGTDGEDEGDDKCDTDDDGADDDGADDDGADDDGADDDGADDDGADDDGPGDKITCATNADCDADEVCTAGLCR
jgi:hypothetical protein